MKEFKEFLSEKVRLSQNNVGNWVRATSGGDEVDILFDKSSVISVRVNNQMIKLSPEDSKDFLTSIKHIDK